MIYRIDQIIPILLKIVWEACERLGYEGDRSELSVSSVPQNMEGDLAVACFPLRNRLSALDDKSIKNPIAIAAAVAAEIQPRSLLSGVVSVGPYVNLTFDTSSLGITVLSEILGQGEEFPILLDQEVQEHTVIEFSAPNTNKPQHLGHVRNNVLGESVARILKKAGNRVTKVNLINDRGIHICKSMLAYKLWGNDATPESTEKKGDHMIGDFYVLFDQKFNEEYKTFLDGEQGRKLFADWKNAGNEKGDLKAFSASFKDTYFNEYSELGREAAKMLFAWEHHDPEVRALQSKLNAWVINGFMETYKKYDVSFDKIYYESDTYTLGKDIVMDGLNRSIFRLRDDGAAIFDLGRISLEGQKVLLRPNGTTVYMTQDLGTAIARYEELAYDHMIYVVADEQNHHFKVLFGILEHLRPEFKDRFEHLSYGMVLLPHGRMKSREGTVVDADDLLDEMTAMVRELMNARGDHEHYENADEENLAHRAHVIASAALKYYLLDVTPPSSLEFNPEKSIDLQGRTGAYCLMNYARTRSVLKKAGYNPEMAAHTGALSSKAEKDALMLLMQYPQVINKSAQLRDPSKIAEYLFKLCKIFAFIFTDKANHPIVSCENDVLRASRLALVDAIGIVLKNGLDLLGIQVLEEM